MQGPTFALHGGSFWCHRAVQGWGQLCRVVCQAGAGGLRVTGARGRVPCLAAAGAGVRHCLPDQAAAEAMETARGGGLGSGPPPDRTPSEAVGVQRGSSRVPVLATWRATLVQHDRGLCARSGDERRLQRGANSLAVSPFFMEGIWALVVLPGRHVWRGCCPRGCRRVGRGPIA